MHVHECNLFNMLNKIRKVLSAGKLLLLVCIFTIKSTLVSSGCPTDFENYQNKICIFYQGYSTDAIKWSDARVACRSRSMSALATIQDDAQESWMVAKWMDRPMTSNNHQTAWFGLVRAGYTESEWNWDDPDSVSQYRHWNPGEPNNFRNREDCGMLIFVKYPNGTKKYGWNDATCEPRYGMVYGRASGYFCSAPYVSDVTTVSPDLQRRLSAQQAIGDAYADIKSSNNALWITLLILLAIVLLFLAFTVWKYKDLMKRKLPVFIGGRTASAEHLDQ